jgi:lipopolysaccharide transport system ATP-binding protein
MSNPIIKAEGLGKKYIISHEHAGAYTALRDVISQKARHLVKSNGTKPPAKEEFWALKDVSFSIDKGEAVGIIGKNGAGKSTLLKILSRITEPTTGRINIYGRVASLLEVGTGFHPELTGRENIFLNGAVLGMSRAEIRQRFDEIIEFSGAEKFLDTPVKRYSTGMYLRLAFAVAAHLEPEILIVDEVLAVGDAEFQKKCLGKMEQVTKGEGRTVLFVSHNMGAINSLCNRAILLSNGKVTCDAPTQECVQQYLSESSKQDHRLKYIAPGISTEPVFIKEITLEGPTDFGNSLFDVDSRLKLLIRLCVKEPITGTTPYFDLKYNGTILYRSFASDCDQDILKVIEPGDYIFSSVLHSPLKKGQYSIDVRLNKIGVKFYEEITEVISFETGELSDDLQNKSYSHKRPGVVGFNKEWQVTMVNRE